MLHDLQVWLVTNIIAHSPVANLMRTAWAWPIVESIHFLGLCMLIGCIGTFDLRLLGVAKRVPIAAVHRLIPFGILGFVINASSGLMFLLTEPDQYIYNPSFHLKFLFITIGGLNAATFYLVQLSPDLRRERVAQSAAARQGHRRDLTDCLGQRHRLRTHAHVLSPGAMFRSADCAAAAMCACPGERSQTMKHLLIVLAIVAAATGGSLSAHHSYSAYDVDRLVEVEGVIDEFEWRAPHSLLKVKADDGGMYIFEWQAPLSAAAERHSAGHAEARRPDCRRRQPPPRVRAEPHPELQIGPASGGRMEVAELVRASLRDFTSLTNVLVGGRRRVGPRRHLHAQAPIEKDLQCLCAAVGREDT